MAKNRNIKSWVFGFLLFMLCIPFLQHNLSFFETKALNGVVETSGEPEFTFEDWFSGEYQKKYDSYADQNTGFRSSLVRLYNQLDYSLFKVGHGQNVVVGLDDYLYQQGYIDEITGANFIGKSIMDVKLKKMKQAQEYLQEQKIFLFTVLAPGKASYCRENIPPWLLVRQGDTTNYQLFLQKQDSLQLNVLDFRKWFLSMKDTSHIPLFPKQGIHWSYYGMALAADSIISYVENSTKKTLTNISWTLEFPDTLRYTDYDIGDLLNLYCKLPYYKMAYPVFQYSSSSIATKPRLLIIGDSYCWNIINSGVYKNVFDNIKFYYYFNTAYSPNSSVLVSLNDLVLLEEIKKFDVIMILQSEANFNNIGFEFPEKLMQEVKSCQDFSAGQFNRLAQDTSFALRIQQIMKESKFDRESAIKHIADSLYIVKKKAIIEIMLSMKNSPEWLQVIKKKSEELNITLEMAMQRDAEWVYDRDHK